MQPKRKQQVQVAPAYNDAWVTELPPLQKRLNELENDIYTTETLINFELKDLKKDRVW